jgi:hypothetical protein
MNRISAQCGINYSRQMPASSNNQIILTAFPVACCLARHMPYTKTAMKRWQKENIIMKKLTMAFVTVLIVAGLASSALADPGWSNGQRYDNRGQYDRPNYPYDQRDYRDHRGYYRQPVVVHRDSDFRPRPVVHYYEPQRPSVRLHFPNFSIQFR